MCEDNYLIVCEIHQAIGSVPHQVNHLVPPESSQWLRGGRERVRIRGSHGRQRRVKLSPWSHHWDWPWPSPIVSLCNTWSSVSRGMQWLDTIWCNTKYVWFHQYFSLTTWYLTLSHLDSSEWCSVSNYHSIDHSTLPPSTPQLSLISCQDYQSYAWFNIASQVKTVTLESYNTKLCMVNCLNFSSSSIRRLELPAPVRPIQWIRNIKLRSLPTPTLSPTNRLTATAEF